MWNPLARVYPISMTLKSSFPIIGNGLTTEERGYVQAQSSLSGDPQGIGKVFLEIDMLSAPHGRKGLPGIGRLRYNLSSRVQLTPRLVYRQPSNPRGPLPRLHVKAMMHVRAE